MAVVHYSIEQSVAEISITNPPVNCLGHQVRLELSQALEAADLDPAVVAVVLMGDGKAFSAGADLNEFDTPQGFAEPTLQKALFQQIEAMDKPVVAAIRGSALGGGCELALGCHYRIADDSAQIGFPEITLGLIPGAGGTQRLPRAAGLEQALNMMLKGNPISAREALEAGIVDELIEGDLRTGARAYAIKAATLRPMPLLRNKRISHRNAAGFLDFVRRSTKSERNGSPGAIPLIDALTAATTLSFDRGMAVESDLFHKLAASMDAQSYRHLFMASRMAGRLPCNSAFKALQSSAVIGAGTMGTGIAICLIDAGLSVRLMDANPQALEKAEASIRRHYQTQFERKTISPDQLAQSLSCLQIVSRYEDIADVDIAIEAVFEDMSIKLDVIKSLDAVLRIDAVLATNTSALDVNQLARATSRPGSFLGLHFFSPANVMKLVEVIRGELTDTSVLEVSLSLIRKMKKVAVIAGVCDGFIGNRIVSQYVRQAMLLLEEGALPWAVDQALERWGMAMGPFRMLDLVGNEIPWAGRKLRYEKYPDEVRTELADKLCQNGWFGQKTGKGWYRYATGAKNGVPNPEVVTMIEDFLAASGRVKRSISPAEIVDRCIYALVNEGASVLSEGVAERASDIDLVLVTGYGFPRKKGGPMFYAERTGMVNVVRQIRRFAAGVSADAKFWTPHPMLIQMAGSGAGYPKPQAGGAN
jgi:3-hydroxyacyl-CoA dehydrogenase